MLNRNALLLVAGAAIFALDASAAAAQDTTRTRRPTSSKRIPITKEAPGEVAPSRTGVAMTPRVDTVTVYKTDTLRMQGRVDTLRVTNTVTRVDTVTQPAIPEVIRQIGGFYIGLAAGSSLPAANFNDSDHPGWRVEVPFGIDPIGSPLGLRFNLGYSRYEPHTYVKSLAQLENAQLMNADADLKVRFVKFQPFNKRVQVYGIGGVSYNRFRNILENNAGQLSVGDVIATNGRFATTDTEWHNGWGYNAGGGLELGWGITNLFVESRYSRFKGENSNISHVPLVIGLSWY